MSELQIKEESRPTRCEICHQNDRFDPETNYCSRCSNIPVQEICNETGVKYKIPYIQSLRNVFPLSVRILMIVGVLFLSYLLYYNWQLRAGPIVNRTENPSSPGGFSYEEGTTRVPQLFAEAKRYMDSNEIAKAEAIYKNIVNIEPEGASGYVGLGTCKLQQRQYALAEEHYRTALQLDERSTMALIGLGTIYLNQHKYPDAINNYQKALSINANIPDAHWGLALVYKDLNSKNEELFHLIKYRQLAPNSNLTDSINKRIKELQ